MTDPTLIAELADIIRQVALIPPEVEITAQSRLVDDLGVDSFDMASIIFSVQDRYDLVVPGDDLPPIHEVAELAEYVLRHRKPVAA